MKPLLAVCGLLVLAVVPGRADQAVELDNPGFEQGLAGWDAAKDNGMSQAIAEAAHDGSLGLRVTDASPKDGSSLASRRFKAVPGKIYQARFWSRAVAGEGVGVYILFFDAAGKSFNLTKEKEIQFDLGPLGIPSSQKEWKEFLIRKTAPEGAVEGQVWIHSYSGAQATADFDEFHVVELEP